MTGLINFCEKSTYNPITSSSLRDNEALDWSIPISWFAASMHPVSTPYEVIKVMYKSLVNAEMRSKLWVTLAEVFPSPMQAAFRPL